MKNTITVIHECGIQYELDGMTISEAIAFLQEYLDNYSPDCILDREDDDIRLITRREETDEEAKIREDKAMKDLMIKQKHREKEDLRAFEILRQRLGR